MAEAERVEVVKFLLKSVAESLYDLADALTDDLEPCGRCGHSVYFHPLERITRHFESHGRCECAGCGCESYVQPAPRVTREME